MEINNTTNIAVTSQHHMRILFLENRKRPSDRKYEKQTVFQSRQYRGNILYYSSLALSKEYLCRFILGYDADSPKAPANVCPHLTPFDPTIRHTASLTVCYSRDTVAGFKLYLELS